MAAAGPDLRTHYSANSRAKCKLCECKIVKGAWRFQLRVTDVVGRDTWQSAHAACFMHFVSDGAPLPNSTRSMPYYSVGTAVGWLQPPALTFPETDDGAAVTAARVAVSEDETANDAIETILPTAGLRDCLKGSVEAAIEGADILEPDDRQILDAFCFYQHLTPKYLAMMNASEAAETSLAQPAESGNPLRGKFTQYSPNSRAHCRDCQTLLEEGKVRVGAHVFSSSARHAGTSINYWCLPCMCAQPAIKRAARLYSDDLERILPGAGLLARFDIEMMCKILKIPLPSEAAMDAIAKAQVRGTRSGRKFGTWGASDEADHPGKRPRRS